MDRREPLAIYEANRRYSVSQLRDFYKSEGMQNEKGQCVILADSHLNVLEGLCGLLETMFEAVVMVADKQSLFEVVNKVQPELAVVDLSLRPSGEVDVAREVRDRYPGLKFIILSVHDDPSVAQSVIETGASGFVLKRCLSTDLFEAVKRVREGRVFVSPSVIGEPEGQGNDSKRPATDSQE